MGGRRRSGHSGCTADRRDDNISRAAWFQLPRWARRPTYLNRDLAPQFNAWESCVSVREFELRNLSARVRRCSRKTLSR